MQLRRHQSIHLLTYPQSREKLWCLSCSRVGADVCFVDCAIHSLGRVENGAHWSRDIESSEVRCVRYPLLLANFEICNTPWNYDQYWSDLSCLVYKIPFRCTRLPPLACHQWLSCGICYLSFWGTEDLYPHDWASVALCILLSIFQWLFTFTNPSVFPLVPRHRCGFPLSHICYSTCLRSLVMMASLHNWGPFTVVSLAGLTSCIATFLAMWALVKSQDTEGRPFETPTIACKQINPLI